MDANIDSVETMKGNLREQGFDPNAVPYVLQLNKRDLPTAVATEAMTESLRFRNEPVYEAVATEGSGVFETLKEVIKQVLHDLKKR